MFRTSEGATPDAPTAGGEDRLVLAGPTLELLLDEVGRRLGPDAEVLSAERSLKGGIGGFFAKEWFTVTAALPGPDMADPDMADPDMADPDESSLEPAAEPVAEHPAERSDDPVAEPVAEPEPQPTVLEIAAGVRAGIAPASTDPGARDFAALLAGALAAADEGDAPVLRPAPRRTMAPRPVAPAAVAARPELPTIEPPTIEPPRIEPSAAERPTLEPVGALLDRLDRTLRPLPEVPARGVVAVVGGLEAALATARSLAVALGLDPDEVMVASPEARPEVPAWLQHHSARTVASRAARWATRPTPVVLAVVLEPGLEGTQWAAEVVQAADPAQVRLVAHAWREPEECIPRVAALGRVDVIDLVEVDEATDPSAFLDLVPPVATLDGRPASSALWAAYLLGRRSTAPVTRPLPTGGIR